MTDLFFMMSTGLRDTQTMKMQFRELLVLGNRLAEPFELRCRFHFCLLSGDTYEPPQRLGDMSAGTGGVGRGGTSGNERRRRVDCGLNCA
jgi:hypothetical protein